MQPGSIPRHLYAELHLTIRGFLNSLSNFLG